VQYALIEIARSGRENAFDWWFRKVFNYWIFKQELLLAGLSIKNFFCTMLFHRSGTFSWTGLLVLPFHQLR
jgi:hypothetical protein